MNRTTGFVLLAVGAVLAFVGVTGTVLALNNLGGGGARRAIPFLIVTFVAVCVLIYAIRGLLRSQSGTGKSKAADRYIPGVVIEHELDNTPYTVHYEPPTKGKHARPSVLTISTVFPESDYEFQLVGETWFDRLCKRLRIAVEVETGDEPFDDECYVRSETPEFASAYLTDPWKRIAILDLRRFGFRELKLDKGKLSALWTGFDPQHHHRDDLETEVAARLLILTRNLPDRQPEFKKRTTSERRHWQSILWAVLIGFALTALTLLAYPPVEAADLLNCALPAAVLLWPVFAVVSAWRLSGTSRSHLGWAWLLGFSLLLIPIGSAGTVTAINGVFDTSPATAHDAMIVDKYTTRSKNTTHYHVRVASWRNPGEMISFDVSWNEYDAVAPGRSKLIVVTHAGTLGIEWRKSKRLEK